MKVRAANNSCSSLSLRKTKTANDLLNYMEHIKTNVSTNKNAKSSFVKTIFERSTNEN